MVRKEVAAIYLDDLTKLLKSNSLLEDLNRGFIRCNFCSQTLTLNNIFAIFNKGQEMGFCCDSENCSNKFNREKIE